MTLDSQTVLDNLPDGIQPNNDFLEALRGKADSKELKDFYQVGLFSYCEGETNNKTGEDKITYCSPRKFQFYFDPLKVWGMNGTSSMAWRCARVGSLGRGSERCARGVTYVPGRWNSPVSFS